MKIDNLIKVLTSILIILFFTSCYTSRSKQVAQLESILQSYMGKHKSEVIQSLGPPTRYDSDGKGGEILIWESSTNVGAWNSYGYVQRTKRTYIMLYSNQNGILYYWRWGSN